MAIVFELCDKSKENNTCKNETEVEKWMEGKYIIMIENMWTFRQNVYNKTRLTANSFMHWELMSTQIRLEKSRLVTFSHVKF